MIISLTVFLWGCNISSTAHFLYPEYANSRRFSTSVLVMPLTPNFLAPAIRDSLFAIQDFETINPAYQELTYFNNYFGPLVSEYSTADVIGVDPYFRTNGISFRKWDFNVDDNTFLRVLAPDSGSIVYRNRVPDFVLFTQDLKFEKDFVEERNGIGEGTSSKYTMVSSLKYLFWDNRKGCVAGYGQIETRRQMMEYPGKTTYLGVLEDFARDMIENSPLVRRQIRQ